MQFKQFWNHFLLFQTLDSYFDAHEFAFASGIIVPSSVCCPVRGPLRKPVRFFATFPAAFMPHFHGLAFYAFTFLFEFGAYHYVSIDFSLNSEPPERRALGLWRTLIRSLHGAKCLRICRFEYKIIVKTNAK